MMMTAEAKMKSRTRAHQTKRKSQKPMMPIRKVKPSCLKRKSKVKAQKYQTS